MKFFHLSDLHIGLKLINRDLREDQEYILKQITDMAEREKPDAVLIAGDIYDKAVPSAEAVEVFDRFISGLAAAGRVDYADQRQSRQRPQAELFPERIVPAECIYDRNASDSAGRSY